MKCEYKIAYASCDKPAQNRRVFCAKHLKAKCVSCGSPSTHQCDETLSLVCGYDLCDNCEHSFSLEHGHTHAPIKKKSQTNVR